ncbi:MAG TPA: cytochrome ubiquinol oxidase subunit I [Ktedonobacteraceae bacterium]|nr:cytochrome ubiquinol oxidase subunit I [Ktedonobacteraceae bacterium]
MSDLLAARAQMGTSLAFHIIFAVLGVGLPLLICIAEGLALRNKDAVWMVLTRRWTKAFAVLFAVGAVSGTVISFELGLLWPTYTKYSGSIIGIPFALEGFAFFLEAIFLGLYLYGWERLSPRAHWLCSFPVWISGAASAWFIVSANSWMNTPTGFEIHNGQVTNINPFQAMLNPSTPYETTHMILACYVATGFAVAAVYAVAMLRGKREEYYRKGLLLGMAMGAIAIPLQIVSGDANARFVAESQPAKLAAMEADFHTQQGAPLVIGGLVDTQTGQVKYALEIPYGLGILATGDPNATITGLDKYPFNDQPDAALVHPSFDGMVASGFFALFVGLLFWAIYFWRRRVVPENRWLLWGIVLTGPLSFLAVELGWMVTELGRQPWVIYNFLRTKDAVTTAPGLNYSFLGFTALYVILAVALIILLLRLAREPLPEMEWSAVNKANGTNEGNEDEEKGAVR